MNSEELERSLRSEFENQIKSLLGEIQQEAADFQQKLDAELEKHRVHMDEAFKGLSERLMNERQLDPAFNETVIEHLRLARDEGARITADAMADAERMAEQAAPVGYDLIRDAINEISSQNTQSSILRSLIRHAWQFMPRGAFFIVRNEHLVGWQAIGGDGQLDEARMRQLSFPTGDDTILGEAVRTMQPVRRSAPSSADGLFLVPMDYGSPGSMFAVPLVARGRGVAVLYADDGGIGERANLDALEMIVRVASLTVEILAANQGIMPARPQPEADRTPKAVEEPRAEAHAVYPVESAPVESSPVVSSEAVVTVAEVQPEPVVEYQAPAVEEPVYSDVSTASEEAASADAPAYDEPVEASVETSPVGWAAYSEEQVVESVEEEVHQVVVNDTHIIETVEDVRAELVEHVVEAAADEPEPSTGFDFRPSDVAAEPVEEVSSPEVMIEAAVPEIETNGSAGSSQRRRGERRVMDRRLDLPIEVPDEERTVHTKARRFARLLVSEIKLYNEQKVHDGREAGDLYERLREAIDRSREMYDRRVEPPVAAKFDYFHYELVNDLAQGDESRLGQGYPGANVN